MHDSEDRVEVPKEAGWYYFKGKIRSYDDGYMDLETFVQVVEERGYKYADFKLERNDSLIHCTGAWFGPLNLEIMLSGKTHQVAPVPKSIQGEGGLWMPIMNKEIQYPNLPYATEGTMFIKVYGDGCEVEQWHESQRPEDAQEITLPPHLRLFEWIPGLREEDL